MTAEHKRVRIAAVLVLVGLLVEGFTLRWSHPTAFFVYAGVGGLVLLLGVLLFLSTLLGGASSHTAPQTDPPGTPQPPSDAEASST